MRRSGTAPSSSAGADARPAHKVEAELKVGFVLPTTPDGSGWSRSHQNGIDLLREKLGDRVQITVLDNVRDVDAEKAFRSWRMRATGSSSAPARAMTA